MAPVVHGLKEEFGDKVNFVVIDIDLNGENEYGPFIEALGYDRRFRPGLYLIDEEGNMLEAWFGIAASQVMRDSINAAMK